ncbi:MAG: hypothetical protein GF353_04655 [Candidatus Lokiarchaeota archaeon]|nr:hypothetical protein [Candidatus Lokiarchaeota archaeon]
MKDRLYKIEEKGKYGFIDYKGNIIITPVYDCVREFSEGVAWVNLKGFKSYYDCLGGKWGFINEKGNIIRDINLDLVNLITFSEGLSWVMFGENKYDGKWGIMNIKGEWVAEPLFNFDKVFAFQNGAAIVESNNKKGYIDKRGRVIFRPQFDSVGAFYDGISWVNTGAQEDQNGFLIGGKWGLVNLSGNFLKHFQYECIQNFSDGNAWVRRTKMGKWGLIDSEGRQILDFKYEKVFRFVNGEAIVKKDSQWRLINSNGNSIILYDDKIQDFEEFSRDLAKIRCNGKYGFIDREGNILLEPRFEVIINSEYAAWVKRDEIWMIFNKKIKKLIKPSIKIEYVYPFIDDYALIQNSQNKWGMIDIKGGILAETKYDYVAYPLDNHVWVNIGGKVGYSGIRGGKWGLIDQSGNFIVKPRFTQIHDFWGTELLDAQIKNKKCYINRKGEIVWSQ